MGPNLFHPMLNKTSANNYIVWAVGTSHL